MTTDLKRQKNFAKTQTTTINKAAEQWIIDTLIMDARFKTMEDIGVSRYQLQGRGLKKETIDRLYKGLYVYSKGFNELINQCVDEDNIAVRGLVWKVFLILLERYNTSDYQMVMQQLIEQHYRDVRQVITDNEAIGCQNSELQSKLIEEQEKQTELHESFKKTEETLQQQLQILNNRYLLADDAAERELEKRFHLENKTGLIRQQFSEMVTKQQLLLDELQYLNKQLQSKQKEVDELLSERKGFVNKIQNQSDEINKQNIKLIECTSTIQLKEELLKNSDELIQKLQSQIIKQQHQVINYNGNQFLFLRQKELEEEDEGKLRQENSELRNRIQQYQQQIDIYIESRQTDLLNQISLLEDTQNRQQKLISELQTKFEKKSQKFNNLQHQYDTLKLSQDITKGNLDINLKKVENLENATSFQIVNNSTLSQYVERLTRCIKKMEDNEQVLNQRINSQFQTIQTLSSQVEQTSRSNQLKIDSLNQQLLAKSIQNDELTLNYRELKASYATMQDQFSKEVLQLQAQNEEQKEKNQNQEIKYYNLEQQYTQLQFDFDTQTKQYDEYLQKKEELNQTIIDQAQRLKKLEKDNTRITQELNWIAIQNEGFSDKIKKQQLIIKDQQKELDQIKYDYSQAQREFEDMKFDYDEQVIFYQQNIQSLVKQKKDQEEDLVQKQQLISKQTQMLQDQSDKLKRMELNLINKEQDVKLIEEKLMLESQKINTLMAKQEDQNDTSDKSTIISQSIQDFIQKKLIPKIKLKRQQGQSNLITIIDSEQEDNNSIQNIIENQLQDDSTLELLLTTIVNQGQPQQCYLQNNLNSQVKQSQQQKYKSQTIIQNSQQLKPILKDKQQRNIPNFRQQQTIEILPTVQSKGSDKNDKITINQSKRNEVNLIQPNQQQSTRKDIRQSSVKRSIMARSETAQNQKQIIEQFSNQVQSDNDFQKQGYVNTSLQDASLTTTQMMRQTYQLQSRYQAISEHEQNNFEDSRRQSRDRIRSDSTKSKKFSQLYKITADYYSKQQ